LETAMHTLKKIYTTPLLLFFLPFRNICCPPPSLPRKMASGVPFCSATRFKCSRLFLQKGWNAQVPCHFPHEDESTIFFFSQNVWNSFYVS
jgi:hypothetical protein